MIEVGLTITVVGMLGVFIFLLLLVVSMSLMSKAIVKFFPEKEETAKAVKKTSDNSEIAAALAAVTVYQTQSKGSK